MTKRMLVGVKARKIVRGSELERDSALCELPAAIIRAGTNPSGRQDSQA